MWGFSPVANALHVMLRCCLTYSDKWNIYHHTDVLIAFDRCMVSYKIKVPCWREDQKENGYCGWAYQFPGQITISIQCKDFGRFLGRFVNCACGLQLSLTHISSLRYRGLPLALMLPMRLECIKP